MNFNKFVYKKRTALRHKLEKYPKLQKITTSLYLSYCNVFGPFHTLPNFLIIGYPKSGTTSLFEYLLKHPNVLPPKGKEIDYFDRLYSRGQNWYKTAFPLQSTMKINSQINKTKMLTGEATPRYIYNPNALHRIKKTLPKCKFIILLRNPIDRAFSHYIMNIKNEYEYLSFEDALKKENERIKNRVKKMKEDPNYFSWNYDLYAYLEHGIYVNQLKRWMEVFPRDQFLIVQSEEFLQNTSQTYQNVLKYLDLPKWEPDEFRLFKKRDYKEKMNVETRKKLSEFFRPNNEKLYEFLGQRFDWE